MAHVVPVALLVANLVEVHHLESLALLIAWTGVDAVGATETVEVVDLNAELEASLLKALARSIE